MNESNVYAWDSFDITISALGTLALLCIAVFVTVGMWRAFIRPLTTIINEGAAGIVAAIIGAILSTAVVATDVLLLRLIYELWTTS